MKKLFATLCFAVMLLYPQTGSTHEMPEDGHARPAPEYMGSEHTAGLQSLSWDHTSGLRQYRSSHRMVFIFGMQAFTPESVWS